MRRLLQLAFGIGAVLALFLVVYDRMNFDLAALDFVSRWAMRLKGQDEFNDFAALDYFLVTGIAYFCLAGAAALAGVQFVTWIIRMGAAAVQGRAIPSTKSARLEAPPYRWLLMPLGVLALSRIIVSL